MKFYFATWPEVTYQGVALTKMGAKTRLISYYYLRDAPEDTLKRYVREGFVTDYEMDGLSDMFTPAGS